MSMTDPLADMLTRIRNSLLRKHLEVVIPHSKLKENLAKVLLEEGFISAYSIKEVTPFAKNIHLALKYDKNNNSVIRKISRVSKPGLRVYTSYQMIKPVMNGQGIYVVSTSQGLLSDSECRLRKTGGEVLCSVY